MDSGSLVSTETKKCLFAAHKQLRKKEEGEWERQDGHYLAEALATERRYLYFLHGEPRRHVTSYFVSYQRTGIISVFLIELTEKKRKAKRLNSRSS